MGFICVLISISRLPGGYFLLVSPRKFCFYTFCCLRFQTWPSFQRLYRSGKDWGSFLWFCCLLCWTHGWKPPWEVLHCNTKMDKLNLLLFFFLLQFPCPGVTMLTTTVIQILASPSQTLGFLFMSKYCSICAKWSKTAQNGTELEYLNPTTHFIFRSLQHKYVFPLVNHAISVALAVPEPAELCSNGGKRCKLQRLFQRTIFSKKCLFSFVFEPNVPYVCLYNLMCFESPARSPGRYRSLEVLGCFECNWQGSY